MRGEKDDHITTNGVSCGYQGFVRMLSPTLLVLLNCYQSTVDIMISSSLLYLFLAVAFNPLTHGVKHCVIQSVD